jgi:hypothetical protein
LNRIVYISDFFLTDLIGGGELNDDVLCALLEENGTQLVKIRSHNVTHRFLKDNRGCFIIISNFINLKKQILSILSKKFDYIIYEHDHKYLINRNPSAFPNYQAPKEQIINYHFYKNAKAIITQTTFHKDIVEKNLKLNNVVTVSGNLWSLSNLEFIRTLSNGEKKDVCAIMNSTIPHKNTIDSVRYCRAKGLEYDLISSNDYHSFLSKMGENKRFVFFPKTPETLSRVVVECRMMNMSTILNKNVGASYEPWFKMKGEKLIDYMTHKRKEIYRTIIEIVNEK